MTDCNLQKNCVKYCRSEGIYNISLRGGKISKGSPTLFVCVNGRFAAFDFTPDEITPVQRLHQAKIQANRGLYYRPRSLEEFVGIVRELEADTNGMRLQVKGGQVGYSLKSLDGKPLHDLMSEKLARQIINNGTVTFSKEIDGFPLCVDGKYFFEAKED